MHDDHSSGSRDQQPSTTEALNGVERDGRGAYVDKGGDQRDEERIRDRAQAGEEDRTEVEDEVDTGQLLHCLHQNTLVIMVSYGVNQSDQSNTYRLSYDGCCCFL